ncbi:hypothetical protein C8R45DRAFT_1079824 [Mycena sanguinolenta]|nr:hypothetical protein C8R45DRAFT_1079824 [Mycena sanguinolenta]
MSSPFALRLGTNYCPTDEEVLEIHSLLVEPTLRIESLHDEIADLQRSIDKLVEERAHLESYVEAHQALLSPVRRLPLDIIQEIFVACMPTHRNCVISATEAPILLGRVCSGWRIISLSTPKLWSSLHIVDPYLSSSNTIGVDDAVYAHKVAQRLEITNMWLGRSGQYPLSISLQGAPGDGDGYLPSATLRFIQALIPFAPRWQHIHFATSATLIFEIINIDMPLLESVALYCEYLVLPQVERGSFNMLKGARISSFSMPGGLCALGRLPLQWNQLTTLTIDGPESPGYTSEMVLPVIIGCSKLQTCKLLLNDGDPGMVVDQHPLVELPFCHTLAIRCASFVTPAVSILLKHLALPVMRNFTLLGAQSEGSDSYTLADFFIRSMRLESFEISINTFSTPSFHETLRALTPTVHRLRIRRMCLPGIGSRDLDDAALKVLATPGLCPALRHLIIDCGPSDAAVLQLIIARMLEFEPPMLQHVEVKFDRDMTIDIMPGLQPFLEAGLAVSLKYWLPRIPSFNPWQGLEDSPDVDLPWVRRRINYW